MSEIFSDMSFMYGIVDSCCSRKSWVGSLPLSSTSRKLFVSALTVNVVVECVDFVVSYGGESIINVA